MKGNISRQVILLVLPNVNHTGLLPGSLLVGSEEDIYGKCLICQSKFISNH